MDRTLYIAAYDITEPRRLQQALDVLKGYSTGGQKSVFECFLTHAERRELLAQVRGVLELDEDRFLLVVAGAGRDVRTLGIGVAPEDPPFFYVG